MILFHTSSRVAPVTMLVAVIAPGFTSGFISGAPVRQRFHGFDGDDRIERAPVASTPIRFSIDSSPCSWMTRPS
jgi:hypothetical protein